MLKPGLRKVQTIRIGYTDETGTGKTKYKAFFWFFLEGKQSIIILTFFFLKM